MKAGGGASFSASRGEALAEFGHLADARSCGSFPNWVPLNLWGYLKEPGFRI